jgi:ribonuclease HI
MKKARMYGDGGARGNPGPAGSGAVIFDLVDGEEGEILAEVGEFFAHATNNQAEYHSIVIGLKKALELGITDLEVRLDSELAVKQINGQYKVKNPILAEKFLEVYNLRQSFDKISFSHVRREQNTHADAIVNRTIDEALGL